MEKQTYYLVFSVDRIPDLTLTKYSVLDGSSVDDIMDKHGVFLRQLHRLGSTADVYFHLLYYYDPDERIPKGHHLSVVFYATSTDRRKLEGIREFLTTSVLSTYYDFHCYEVSTEFEADVFPVQGEQIAPVNLNALYAEVGELKEKPLKRGSLVLYRHTFGRRIRIDSESGKLQFFKDGNDDSIYEEYEYDLSEGLEKHLKNGMDIADNGMMFIGYFRDESDVIFDLEMQPVQCVVDLVNIAGERKIYGISEKDICKLKKYKSNIERGIQQALSFELASDGDAILSFNSLNAQKDGKILFPRKYVLAQRAQIIDGQLWLFDGDQENEIGEAYECELHASQQKVSLQEGITASKGNKLICYFEQDGSKIVEIGSQEVICDEDHNIVSQNLQMERKFAYSAFLTKKDYFLPAQNRLSTDEAGEVHLYSIMEWEPCEDGRLYNVLKLMEGYNRTAALRVDIFPREHTQLIRQMLPYADTRRRISERSQGKDDNSENILKSWDKYLQNLMKFPQFYANVVAYADSKDIAVMLADSVAAEAVESGTYLVEDDYSEEGFSVYDSDETVLAHLEQKAPDNYISKFLSLYTLEEIRPMFSFPILYQGESIECLKETDPKPFGERDGESISLGVSSLGYDVEFPVKLFKKHAFVAGVPGAGKTNTMLHLVTSLWRDTKEKIPFLVLEPAKQEYRALAKIEGMEALRIFSPGADTYFPLHINPFQFPVGLTLAEHIANLNAVFAGAFELPPPSPHFIDSCIEKVYLDKGWNVNERNTLDENGKYRHEFPTLQELYASLEVAVKNSHYQGETLGNLQSVLEVRVGSLLKREIGNVYNVRESILKPEEWLDVPAIIELEALGEGPANFMSLLLSTLIRETLKVRKTSDHKEKGRKEKDLNHVIFYEEAHNLIGPDTDSPMGDSVDPKISATKYVVKMLAEVRALGEGIVIADQLPTVMAPEVLKNTGLKIAHRITAQDDRGLLGSTMSATADQLEEQGTFGTGWALIFYEDLLKPYKMRVHEWDAQNKDKDKYNSPTNRQLFGYLKENAVYQQSMKKSAEIMKDKITIEYSLLHERAAKLMEKLSREYRVLRSMENGIENQKELNQEKMTAAEKERYETEIRKQIQVYEKDRDNYLTRYGRELHMLCWDYLNQYYASITLAQNYEFFTYTLHIQAVAGFLRLFEILYPLTNVAEFVEILASETKNAMEDIRKYVSMDGQDDPILKNSTEYEELVYLSGYYWVNTIFLEKEAFVAKAKRIMQATIDRESYIKTFCEEWTKQFMIYSQKADTYAAAVEIQFKKKAEKAKENYLERPDIYEQLMASANKLEGKKYLLYKYLHAYVVQPVSKALNQLKESERICFLKSSKMIREEYRKIVDYLDGKTQTKLSGCKTYKEYRATATILANMDLCARIELAKLEKAEKIEQLLLAESKEDKERLISEIVYQHNLYFSLYQSYDVERQDYAIILVDFYLQFLDSMMDLGSMSRDYIKDHNKVVACNQLFQQLKEKHLIPEAQQISWNRILTKWNNLNRKA